MNKWSVTKLDKTMIRELQSFLPDKAFDSHAHLYRVQDLLPAHRKSFGRGPQVVGEPVWRKQVGALVGGSRLKGGMFTPVPATLAEMDDANDFLATEMRRTPGSRGLILVAPRYSQQSVLKYLEHPGIAGFKPYHYLSGQKDSFECQINAYLPEWAWKLADERELVILLHMVRSKALSDPGNQKTIRRMCEKYPKAKLVLAHAARGFHTPNTIRGLHALRGLTNVWFDTAAVCESAAIVAILHAFGPRRVMWGTDFPVSEDRGKCVTLGDGFAWVVDGAVDWKKFSPCCHPALVGIESLAAVREAADTFGLSSQDLGDLFYNNAAALLGIEKPAGTLTQDLYRHAKQRIPGGVQLLSKRPEQYAPGQWPAYFAEARGCETWDIDGRHYYDVTTMGIGACPLGFRDPDVTRAVQRRLTLGSMCTLNPPDEVELADLLCEIHPWAQQVRFGRSGGEMAAVAIRTARATTDRSLVAICGYHGWHDWYLAANLGDSDALRGHLLPGLNPYGVPRELRGTALPFRYGDRDAFQKILSEHGKELAAVIMEPCRNQDPERGFLEFIQDGAHACGAMLIFDEISIGWRLEVGGAHLRFGVNPDIAVFAKALGNGHPMAAIIGTAAAMEGAHKSFISSTYWTEAIGPAAALATVRKMQKVQLPAHIARAGTLVQQAWKTNAAKHKVPLVVEAGYPCFAHAHFEHKLANDLRTLYTQLMLQRGFLANLSIYPALPHTAEIIALYSAAMDEVFAEIASALDAGTVSERLKGTGAHSGFSRLL